MKKKILLSPLIIIVLIIIAGVGLAGAAIFIGNTTGDGNSLGVNLQKGLVGWWKMDGNANDFSAYRNNGTVTGATLTIDRKGQTNKAYLFNGTTAYISLASMPLSGTAYTVSAWFKSSDPSVAKGIFAQRSSSDVDSIMGQLYFPTGSPNIAFITRADNAANSALAQGTTTLQANTWYHAVGVRNGANVYVYLNGVQEGTDTDAGGTITTNMTDIGRYGGITPAGYFDGSIDDVRIYNRALSATEVTALYQEYNPGIQISDLQKGLVGNWKLDGNANDFSAYDNNGTVTGATLTTDRKGQVNKAYNFDGTTSVIDAGAPTSLANLSAISVSAWINPTSFGENSRGRIVDKADTGWVFFLDNSNITNGLNFAVATSGTQLERRSVNNAIVTGQWQHVVMTWTGTLTEASVKYYVNGVETTYQDAVDSTGTRSDDSAATLKIGNNSAATRTFDGKIDDVRIYNRALSATEIQALYAEYNPSVQISDLQKGLVGQWKMDGNANDFSAYRNNGTVTGATLTTDRKSQVSKAYNFNGTTDFIQLPAFSKGGSSANKITISAWVTNTDFASANRRTIFSTTNANTAGGVSLEMGHAAGQISAIIPGVFLAETAAGVIADSNWHHIVYVRSGNGADNAIYVDGVSQSLAVNLSNGFVDTGEFKQIGERASGSQLWQGKIDDVRVYNRALTATEVTQLYESY